MIRVCAWHPKLFNSRYVMGEVEPLADKSETHTACPMCEKKLSEQLDRMEKAARTKEIP